ncbi:MAG: PAS domain S-box protein [Ignavibacteria bacterium]|nr:MAG: PAS domain S-box protein [Ignavibacteria bacterium]
MTQNHTNYSGINSKFFITAAFLFSLAVYFIDAIVDSIFFYPNEYFYNVLFPDPGTHEFYMRTMLIFTFVLFGLIINYFLKKEFETTEKLQKSELKFRTLANFTNDMDYWISPRREIVFISPSCEEITGYSPDEFSNDIKLLDKIICEEDRTTWLEHENAALKGAEVSPIEFRIKRKDGKTVWISHVCRSIYDSKGNYIGHRVSNRDITQRKLAEEELRWLSEELQSANKELERLLQITQNEQHLLFSHSPYAKALLNKELEFLDVNPALINMFQVDKEHLIGRKIKDCEILNNKDVISYVEDAIRRKTVVKSHAIYLESLDKLVIVDAYPLSSDNDEPTKIIMNLEDVTEKVKMLEVNTELDEQKKMFDQLFDYLEFERNRISRELHDHIGQKLLFVKMQTEVIKNTKKLNEEILDKTLETLSDLHKDIRSIIYSLYPAELEKFGLVDSIQLLVDKTSKIGNVKVNFKISGEYHRLNIKTELNCYRIVQEILNNILKHAEAKRIDINLTFENNILQIEIVDDGKGFDLNKLHSPGYGLVSIRERTRLLNGHVEINSELGKGTQVIIDFPWELTNEEN